MINKLIIIGSGPAAWTASIYSARANLTPIVYEGKPSKTEIPGGQLMFTTEVENFPGFPNGINGPQLMELMKKQAMRFNVKTFMEQIVKIDSSTNPFKLYDSKNNLIMAHSIIIATGASAKWLGIPNEIELSQKGGGVSACAVCDGALPVFRNKELAIVGGGDTAMEEAIYLTKFASKVHLIHRRDKFRASTYMQNKVFENKLINIHWNSKVIEIKGDKNIKSINIENIENNKVFNLPISGLFIAIGHKPNTSFLDKNIKLDKKGYIIANKPFRTNTSVEGIFAAGDVIDSYYRQAITSAGTGCMAAMDTEKWLFEKNIH